MPDYTIKDAILGNASNSNPLTFTLQFNQNKATLESISKLPVILHLSSGGILSNWSNMPRRITGSTYAYIAYLRGRVSKDTSFNYAQMDGYLLVYNPYSITDNWMYKINATLPYLTAYNSTRNLAWEMLEKYAPWHIERASA